MYDNALHISPFHSLADNDRPLSNAVQLMYLHSGVVIGTAGGLIFHCDVAPD